MIRIGPEALLASGKKMTKTSIAIRKHTDHGAGQWRYEKYRIAGNRVVIAPGLRYAHD
jgi:hypothetical protein